MFKTLRLGCFLYSLLMLIPTLAALAVLLIGASALGLLPTSINDPVVSAERIVTGQMLNSDLSSAKLSVRSIAVTPLKTAGHADLTVAVDSSTPLPKDPKPLAATVMSACAAHLGMPFGLAVQSIDAVTVVIYGPNATSPALTATINRPLLDQYVGGQISKATFLTDLTVK